MTSVFFSPNIQLRVPLRSPAFRSNGLPISVRVVPSFVGKINQPTSFEKSNLRLLVAVAKSLVLSIVFLILACHSNAQTENQQRPFSEKPLVFPHIHAENRSLFRPWSESEVPLGAYDPSAFKRHRLGTISLAPGIQAHIDAVENTVHFPSYFELIDVRMGSTLGIYPVFSIDDAEWYFGGNSVVYLNQRHPSLCGPRYTRKFSIEARSIVEVPQPILYVGAETEALKATPLYEAPLSKTVVATVLPNARVTVIGLHFGLPIDAAPALLIRTPFGLTGWHRRDGADGNGSLLIYQCN